MAKAGPTIDDVLKLAQEVDEAALDAQIVEAEALVKRLKAAKQTIRVLKHGRPERKAPKPRKPRELTPATIGANGGAASNGSASSERTIKQRVIDRLKQHSPAKPGTIAGDLGLRLEQVQGVFNTNPHLFDRRSDGYVLAREAMANGEVH